MGQRRRSGRGKIAKVCAAVRQVEDAVRRDLLSLGRSFDDGSLSWDDLHAVIFAAPPGSAVFHAVERGWGTTDHLLAHVIDALKINNWQRTEGARKKPPRNVPEPFPRPGDEVQKPSDGDDTVVSVAGVAAKVTTVSKFLELREKRKRRWLRRNGR